MILKRQKVSSRCGGGGGGVGVGVDGAIPTPGPIKISHKKMTAKGGRIDFMFFGPFPTWPLDPCTIGYLYNKETIAVVRNKKKTYIY